jgi:uncharacterized protein (DUF1697 family)
MQRYIAFLRGINVSGQKIVKMETLRNTVAKAGFENIKTYIQSGNLLFDSNAEDEKQIIQQLETLIELSFGFRTEIILLKKTEIETLINSPIYASLLIDKSKKYYITFLKEDYSQPFQVPLFSKNKDVEIIYHNNRSLVSVSTLYKGNFGFPNAFIEKLTGIPATTRNPITLGKIAEL